MQWFDIVNGCFEFLTAPFICISIVKLYKEKQVQGVSWIHVGFITLWGYWNMFYYPKLNQWASFIGAIVIVITNSIWFVMMLYYNRKNKNG